VLRVCACCRTDRGTHMHTCSSRCLRESLDVLSSCTDCCGLPDWLLCCSSSSLSTALCSTLTDGLSAMLLLGCVYLGSVARKWPRGPGSCDRALGAVATAGQVSPRSRRHNLPAAGASSRMLEGQDATEQCLFGELRAGMQTTAAEKERGKQRRAWGVLAERARCWGAG
jgi:hypothetical protein